MALPVVPSPPAQEGPCSPCPPRLRKYVLAVAVMGSALGFIDATIITVAIQPIRADLDASFAAMQWVVNGYTLALAAFLLVGGAAGDRFGKRRVFACGLVLFATASGLCALAPNIEALLAARIVQGFGAALLVPGSLALIAVNVPETERGRAVGIWAAASGITTALGPLAGGLLIDLGSWRAIFVVNLPLAALALSVLLARVPADAPTGGGRFDLAGATLAFLAVGLVAFGFTLAEQTSLGDPRVLAAIVAGVLLAAAFVAWEDRAASPMLPLSLFASRTFAIANGATLLIYFALGGTVLFLPVTMMAAHDWSAVTAGAIFVPFTIAMSVVAPVAGRFADRVGTRTLLVTGPLVVALALLWLGRAVVDADFWSGVAPAMMAFGFGMGLAIPPLSTAILNDVPTARTGVASGVNNAAARVAGLLAVAVLGLAASGLYRAATGIADVGFAAQLDTIGQAARAEAILTTFSTLALACSALAASAGTLALILPKAAATAPATPPP